MDNAGLIDHGSAGVVRSISEVPLVGSISRGPSTFSSASPPREPTATSNPSGGNAAPATAGPVGTTMVSASPPRTDEDVSKLDLAILACSISVLVPVALNFKDLTSSWDAPWKELYGVLMIVSIASTVAGFFTTWCPKGSWGSRLSPTCARFGLVDAATLFIIIFLACKLGRLGWAAGVAAAALVVLVLVVA